MEVLPEIIYHCTDDQRLEKFFHICKLISAEQ
jgi:hypothetical protein